MLSMEKFAVWVLDQLNERGWRSVDLAQKAGISEGAVSNVLNGYRRPGPDVCRSIAHALRVAEEEVFRRAGLLSPKPELSDQAEELRAIIGLLKEENVAYVAEIARWRLNQQAQEDDPPEAGDPKRARLIKKMKEMTPEQREDTIKNQMSRSRQQGSSGRTKKG